MEWGWDPVTYRYEQRRHKHSDARRGACAMSDAEDRVTVWASSELVERMDDRVDWRYGSRSEWVREAIRYRMVLEDALDREGWSCPRPTRARADARGHRPGRRAGVCRRFGI